MVSSDGDPIQGALLFLWTMVANQEGGPVAVTDAQGRFAVRDVPANYRLAARAPGHVPSPVQRVKPTAGATTTMDFVLVQNGASLHGRVVDGSGAPIPHAQVFAGPERIESIRSNGTPGEEILCSADGEFEVASVATGALALQIRAPGFAPVQRSVVVGADSMVSVELALEREAVVRGTLRDEAGDPVSGGNVFWGDAWSFAGAHTKSGPDGSFTLGGLPAGEVELWANDNGQLRTEVALSLRAGETTAWDPVLSAGAVLRGHLRLDDGQPLDGWYLYATTLGEPHWYTGVHTDSTGSFAIAQRPEGAEITLNVCKPGAAAAVQVVRDIPPADNDLELVVPRAALPSAALSGRLLRADGTPASDASIWLGFEGHLTEQRHVPDPKTGRFQIEPLPPGREYRLTVRIDARGVLTRDTPALVAEETLDLGDLVVRSRD